MDHFNIHIIAGFMCSVTIVNCHTYNFMALPGEFELKARGKWPLYYTHPEYHLLYMCYGWDSAYASYQLLSQMV